MRKIITSALSLFFILLITNFIHCKKDNDNKDISLLTSGEWSGTGISFTVGGSPLCVYNLVFHYSGYAIGEYCSLSYHSIANIDSCIIINSEEFLYSDSSYDIEGTFTSYTTAEIKVAWSLYDSFCAASDSDSNTYTATSNALKKSVDVNPEKLIIKDTNSETFIIQKYLN